MIAPRSERGQVAVLFALLLPVLFALGAVVLDVGNWYIHKRHLQTQVDAAALAPAPEFTGCFDPAAWVQTDQAIEDHAIGFAGDTLRPGVLGTNPSDTTNRQLGEPDDVRVVLNADRYWAVGDPKDPSIPSPNSPADGYGLDQTLDEKGPTPGSAPDGFSGFCNEGYIDVKATEEDVPFLLGLLPIAPDPKSHARAQIFDISVSEGILPFAVPEVIPGSVYALFVNEDRPEATAVISRARLCGTPCVPVPTPSPAPAGYPSDYAVYQGSNVGQPITFGTGTENVGVIILVSRADIPTPNVGSPSITTTCSQTGVKCYSGGGATSGLALLHGYETGSGPGPIARQVDVGGCDSAPNLSGPYFNLTGDCLVSINAELDFSGFTNPEARTHLSASCGGNGTPMSQSGGIWTSVETLPEPDAGGQVPISISWNAAGPGGWRCLGMVARLYVKEGGGIAVKSGPVHYLDITAAPANPPAITNAYSTPNEPSQQPVTYTVTAGLLPPLRTQTLSDKPVLIRFASEDNPSQTQSIDCDVDSWPYPAPYNTLPADSAEIAHGCVTPYAENETLDCSAYSFGDLPPPMPGTTFDNAPNCAQSKAGSVSSLRKGLVARLNEPTCAPNNWPDAPITPEKITALVTDFADDPRLVTLVVTEFGAFSGTGATIIPIRYFAGFYITGKDVSAQSPRCAVPGFEEDLHPVYGDTYSTTKKQKLDDGDVWGYFVVRVEYGSGAIGNEECDFTGAPENCVLALVR
jgi:hypothetical protein